MDNNVVVVLAIALTGLQNVIAILKERRIMALPTFSRWSDKNVWEFIQKLEIVFLTNQITNNRKFHIEVSCLIGITTN